ncbi:MAG: hypothetical protein EA409_13085 [Saprospirales bacterium]|nr:MAG: hypothetical protein EA409_13085 [Saprospirales bacterium]
MLKNLFIVLGLLVVTSFIFSCKPTYEVDTFEIIRPGWDMININTSYKKSTTFGEEFSYPKSEKVIIRDSRSQILYEGPAISNIAIPDKELLSEEKISVRLIAFFDDAQVSSEKHFFASPKRFTMNHNVKYPNGGLNHLDYEINFNIYRKKINSTEEEKILSGAALPFNINMSVNGGSNISFASDRRRDRMDLRRSSAGSQFVSSLVSELEKNNKADVHFAVEMDYRGRKIKFQPIEKTIQNKSDSEKRMEAERLAGQLGAQKMNSISPNTGNSLQVVVDHINVEYDLIEHRYSIPMEIQWRARTWIAGPTSDMIIRGTLNVNEDGSNPAFDIDWHSPAVGQAAQNNSVFNSSMKVLENVLQSGL